MNQADRTSRAVGRSASHGNRVLSAGLGVALLVLVVGCAPAAPAASPAAPAQPPPQVQQIRFLLDFVLDGTHTPYFVARDKGWKITQILNTHEHGDHTGGNAGMVAATGAKVLAHAGAASRIG